MKAEWKYPPSLFERLTEDDDSKAKFDVHRINAGKMRRLVIAEILELLNHANVENTIDNERFPQVASSSMNYGIPKRIAYDNPEDWQVVEHDIRTAILRFEPRVIPETLVVHILRDHEKSGKYAVIIFEISALIYWLPAPLDLYVKGLYDVDSDQVTIS